MDETQKQYLMMEVFELSSKDSFCSDYSCK